MFKQNRNQNQSRCFIFPWVLASFILFTTSRISNASIEFTEFNEFTKFNDDSVQSNLKSSIQTFGAHYSPVQAIITGQVKFESRYTRVHNAECTGQPCQKSQKYWSLVIVSQGHRYVLNQELNIGEDAPPVSVEVAGRTLKAGAIIKVDGQITSAGLTSYFIINIQSIEVIAGTGWVCHSTSADMPNVNVRVWYDLTQGEGAYKIQVEQACSLSIYPIATVQDAKVALHTSEFIYSGTSEYSGQSSRVSKIDLHIQTAPHQALDLNSSLKIETVRGGNGDQPWAGAVIPLKCSQARLSAGE